MDIGLDFSKNLRNKENQKEIKLNKKGNFNKTVENIANIALDLGIRAALPNYIEDQVIEIKNIILKNGVKEGVKEISNKAKNIFETFVGKNGKTKISELRELTKQNGLMKSFSKILSEAIDFSIKHKMISKEVGSLLKSGKNAMVSDFSRKLENKMMKEIKAVEKFKEAYIKWEKGLENNDLEEINKNYEIIIKNYNKISSDLKDIIDVEKVEYINNYLNKNGDKEIEKEDFELLKKIA